MKAVLEAVVPGPVVSYGTESESSDPEPNDATVCWKLFKQEPKSSPIVEK